MFNWLKAIPLHPTAGQRLKMLSKSVKIIFSIKDFIPHDINVQLCVVSHINTPVSYCEKVQRL